MKKLLLTLSLFCFISISALAQDTPSDRTPIRIENPMNATPQQYEILGIEVEGLTTSREEFVIGTSGLQVGNQITIPGEQVGQAIKSLHQTGLFSDVEIVQAGREAGGIYLKIIVQEQPRLETFEIEGVKRSEREDLREKITLIPGYAVTESSIAQAVNTIKRYYKQEGHRFTKVEVRRSETDEVRNRVTVTFDIDAGERLEVKDITFEGNEEFSDKELQKSLGTIKEDKWWKFFSKKLFKESEFEEAKDNLAQFYRDNGFLDFRITSDTVYTFPYTQRRLYVFETPAQGIKTNISVYEGAQYKVRNVTWEGNTVYTDEQLTQTLGFEKGEVFNQSKFDTRLNINQKGPDVTSLYQDIGYLFFQVEPQIEMVAEDSVDLNMTIIEDEIAYVKRVSFEGNTKTHDDVIRRTLRTVPGQKYSRQAIIRTIRELGQIGYFQQQSIEPDIIPDRENQTVDINYSLDESQSTDNFEFSGGFGGRGIGLILSARVNFNNFSIQRALRGEGWTPIPSGDGQKLSLGVQVTGSGYQSYSAGFQEPWLSGKPLSLGVNMSYDLIKYRGSDQRNELFSSSVSLGRRLDWPDDYFTHQSILSYQLYDVAGGASFLPEGASNILSIQQVLERNSTDNKISPTTGSKLRISGEIAPPLPSFAQYYKFKSSYQNHTSIVGDLVLTNTVEYGYLGYLSQGKRSDFQRFKLGGTQMQQRQSFLDDNIDLRGFPGGRNGSITPFEDGQEVGGRLYTKYSFELRYPAITEQQAQVYPYAFMDAGNAYLNPSEFAPFDVKRSVGLGTRIFLPILGLVDLSYGYRLDGIPNTQVRAGEWEFLFNIGAPF
ncbi:outer membrane protein assembly factor BamA [Fodinibius sediminis]|uniref:Outer membrane protein assembly factor BamA n=1 Tax=Fodinibius sediminis TaxID=1214077 RepID=A0A521E0D2_9BACT|nr:outer membrane protein assembly factor BamA [Fodinibius sediminis]SMO77429.1 Beta-barrel assembly machine subunit BamA [Fodinibius sediminis]